MSQLVTMSPTGPPHVLLSPAIEVHRPGIEPGPPAWQASILPLNHPMSFSPLLYYHHHRPPSTHHQHHFILLPLTNITITTLRCHHHNQYHHYHHATNTMPLPPHNHHSSHYYMRKSNVESLSKMLGRFLKDVKSSGKLKTTTTTTTNFYA